MNWMNQVDEYLFRLNETAISVADAVVGLEFATQQAATDEINAQSAKMGALLAVLEAKLAERETLLSKCPSNEQQAPTSLQAALQAVKHPKATELAERCARIGSELQFVHRKSVGLFVGQFHLVNVTEEFLRMLSGVSAKPITYDDSESLEGGSLLDRAA